MPHFWTKGAENYEKALREQYEAQCKHLQDQLKKCDDTIERLVLAEELNALKKDFQSRLRGMGRSLF